MEHTISKDDGGGFDTLLVSGLTLTCLPFMFSRYSLV